MAGKSTAMTAYQVSLARTVGDDIKTMLQFNADVQALGRITGWNADDMTAFALEHCSEFRHDDLRVALESEYRRRDEISSVSIALASRVMTLAGRHSATGDAAWDDDWDDARMAIQSALNDLTVKLEGKLRH